MNDAADDWWIGEKITLAPLCNEAMYSIKKIFSYVGLMRKKNIAR